MFDASDQRTDYCYIQIFFAAQKKEKQWRHRGKNGINCALMRQPTKIRGLHHRLQMSLNCRIMLKKSERNEPNNTTQSTLAEILNSIQKFNTKRKIFKVIVPRTFQHAERALCSVACEWQNCGNTRKSPAVLPQMCSASTPRHSKQQRHQEQDWQKNEETSIDFCNLGTKNEVANEPMIGAMQSDECIMNFFNPRADSWATSTHRACAIGAKRNEEFQGKRLLLQEVHQRIEDCLRVTFGELKDAEEQFFRYAHLVADTNIRRTNADDLYAGGFVNRHAIKAYILDPLDGALANDLQKKEKNRRSPTKKWVRENLSKCREMCDQVKKLPRTCWGWLRKRMCCCDTWHCELRTGLETRESRGQAACRAQFAECPQSWSEESDNIMTKCEQNRGNDCKPGMVRISHCENEPNLEHDKTMYQAKIRH